ncbi:MAG: protein-methionine-sulfoxide reductase heme-binding subunit MsrQ [Gammaproteobacteria bacterium]|nr:protein-methionine-sulfoxide reductase heme-binding subunit MsrQ [Gammaproteobacteria bacterium]
MMVLVNRLTPAIKVVVFLVCLIPLGLLVWNFIQGELGANPIEAVIHTTGDWTLRLLLISLSITPLKIITGNAYWVRFRRMLGLFAFFYATLHLCGYVVLDQFFDWSAIIKDIIKRPYITVGFLAWVLMIPLAVTSTRKMMSRLGSRWKRLHKLVYWIAALGVLHFLWLVKADLREPLLYAGILALLLLVRLKPKLRT